MTVKEQVLSQLRNKEWVSVEDMEKVFPPRTPGHLSWPQRLRELREDGFTIIKRRKENCAFTFEYSLVEPEPARTEQEEVIAENNLVQEQAINYKQLELAI